MTDQRISLQILKAARIILFQSKITSAHISIQYLQTNIAETLWMDLQKLNKRELTSRDHKSNKENQFCSVKQSLDCKRGHLSCVVLNWQGNMTVFFCSTEINWELFVRLVHTSRETDEEWNKRIRVKCNQVPPFKNPTMVDLLWAITNILPK